MKAKLLLVLLLWAGVVWGQVTVVDKSITLDLSNKIDSIEIIVEGGKAYKFETRGSYKGISISKGVKLYPKLSPDTLQLEKVLTNSKFPDLKFGRNTQYTIVVRQLDEPTTRKYIIKSQSDWSWTTTFGANAIFFSNRSKFISQKADDNSQKVVKIQDRKLMEVLPTIMFTFMNNHNNAPFGFTGGLGINFEEIAVFSGVSLGIGQNIILTGGMGVHKQMRPNSAYYMGQTIDSSITNENLNESQYRVNPFVGISFRLDKNPFGKKTE